MTKISKKTVEKIELRSDGWVRLKDAVHTAAKSGPKPRITNKTTKKQKAKN